MWLRYHCNDLVASWLLCHLSVGDSFGPISKMFRSPCLDSVYVNRDCLILNWFN